MNRYCEICKCWHRPDGTKADGPEDEFDRKRKRKTETK
ncbi:MAG: hypothetical protein A4E45_00052 [Methanosaeta sp. PtaB.Bin039]|nr:MAG: hypothetical protein A4E45_00052 [Methanosaeta sp. PtaB.Bin039]